MARERKSARETRRVGLLATLGLLSVALALLLLSPAVAQETPGATPVATAGGETPTVQTPAATETPGAQPTAGATEPTSETPGAIGTSEPTATVELPPDAPQVRMEVDDFPEPLQNGVEFEVRVLVENVERLGGAGFTIRYDPDRLDFDRIDDRGQFLATGERQDISCEEPETGEDTVTVDCITFGPPVCAGGLPGASGSGLLGRVFFTSKGGGATQLELTKTTLVLDDIEPCDEEGATISIPHNRGDPITVDLVGGDEFPWLIVGIIIGVVAVLLIGGVGGFLWYRRQGAGTTPGAPPSSA